VEARIARLQGEACNGTSCMEKESKMKNGNRWYLATFSAAALAVAGTASAATESHMGEAGPPFQVAPITTLDHSESHMGEAGPAFPVAPVTTLDHTESHMGEAGPAFPVAAVTSDHGAKPAERTAKAN
jgi:hypothetical protein